ncbi:uncharacterized protein [Penaeus vannamei]|uniref:uncharacterized protein n=1 Tax=Penaeus vannamei TaxID=6689 RepID=UPI00387F3CC7
MPTLVAHSLEDIHDVMDTFAKSSPEFGLTFNAQKTEDPSLNDMPMFRYLGSMMTVGTLLDAELNCRIKSASATFTRLKDRVWNQKDLKRSTKMRVYQAAVMPTLLYSAETCTPYQRHPSARSASPATPANYLGCFLEGLLDEC